MDRFSIPRDALASLLQAAGSPLTPEAYIASLSEFDSYRKYSSRAAMSAGSKYCLLVAAILSGLWTCIPFGFGFESILVTLILAVITFFEFRVNRGFRERLSEAPTIGFRNQSAFAAFILIYGLYHAFAPMNLPPDYREKMDPDLTQMFQTLNLVTYLAIGIVGGFSQFCLAWYYRKARI